MAFFKGWPFKLVGLVQTVLADPVSGNTSKKISA